MAVSAHRRLCSPPRLLRHIEQPLRLGLTLITIDRKLTALAATEFLSSLPDSVAKENTACVVVKQADFYLSRAAVRLKKGRTHSRNIHIRPVSAGTMGYCQVTLDVP